MRLSKINKERLKTKGLTVWETENRGMVSKNAGVGGNSIPNFRHLSFANAETGETAESKLDAPPIYVWIFGNEYELRCWNWIPGPGPGDFDITFDTEDKAIEFILSYYFGENEYFEARRSYEEKKSAS